jgi:hypothetical protein
MDDNIDPVYRPSQSVFVPDVARKKATAIVVEFGFECREARFALVENSDDVRVTPTQASNQNSTD